MRVPTAVVASALALFAASLGWAAGCGSSVAGAPADAGLAPAVDAATSDAPTACPACMTASDCAGLVCAQFAGDSYCAPACSASSGCAADRTCETLTTATGEQASVCVPLGDVCGPPVGLAMDAGAPDAGACGALVAPDVPASCTCGAGKTCTPNGCYGGFWCDAMTGRCHAPPPGCAGDGGSSGPMSGPYDAGGPVTGMVGTDGGALNRLFFAVIGDTRPGNIDDTAGYPTPIITKIFQGIVAMSPMPAFAVSTGDYMFASTTGTEQPAQLDLYVGARGAFAAANLVEFPALGNHECTGYTNSNCGPGDASDGITANYTTFLTKMLAPIGQTSPYFAVNVAATDASWTAKLVFVAANAWSDAQATWLDGVMAQPTTYTFVIRHEPAAASTAPGVTPSEAIMAMHPYTLALVGHTHTYTKSGPREVIVGNGGAPITSGAGDYGFGVVSQRPDGAVVMDMIDYQTGLADETFRFAVNPDGTPAL